MLSKPIYTARRYQRQQVEFGGLDLRDGAPDGALVAGQNISCRKEPYLCQRPGWEELPEANGDTSAFSWDGHIITAKGGVLSMDGSPLCGCSEGEKQFAVVNTKLIVWPDKIEVDLVNKKGINHGAGMTSMEGGTVTFGTNYIIFPDETDPTQYTQWPKAITFYMGGDSKSVPWFLTYTSVSYDSKNGTWNVSGEELLPMYNSPNSIIGRYIIPTETDTGGMWFYSDAAWGPFDGTERDLWTNSGSVEQEKERLRKRNTKGCYGKIVDIDWIDDCVLYLNDKREVVIKGSGRPKIEIQGGFPGLSDIFAVGDIVDVSGALKHQGYRNRTGAKVTYVSRTQINLDKTISSSYTGSDSGRITIRRQIKDLDFICEKDNRLWGVCNTGEGGRTICASALGDPLIFDEFQGVSTDSYQVAVASEGDFTGICQYGGAVLAWKEHELVKVVGSYPEEYATYTYAVDGVQKGAHRSLKNVNEALYYKGVTGVFRYSGGVPAMISQAFGNRRYVGGVAGTDGWRYWLSTKERDGGEAVLLAYDTRCGAWMPEDDTQADDFVRYGDGCAILTGGKLYRMEANQEAVDWMMEFAPWREDSFQRKSFVKLLLRIELTGTCTVEVSHDGQPWRVAAKLRADRKQVRTIPIRPKRCDSMRLRVSGRGTFTLLGIQRELHAYSTEGGQRL